MQPVRKRFVAARQRRLCLLYAYQHPAHFYVFLLVGESQEVGQACNYARFADVTFKSPYRLLSLCAGAIVESKRRFHEVEQIVVIAVVSDDIEPAAYDRSRTGG